MSLPLDRKGYFEQQINIEPFFIKDEDLAEIRKIAKVFLVEAAINYLDKGERIQKLLLNNDKETFTLKVKPNKVGACVIQVANGNPFFKITKIDFHQLQQDYAKSRTNFDNCYDFNLIENAISTQNVKECRSSCFMTREMYRERIHLIPIGSDEMKPLVEKAKDIIVEAALHFEMTNVNNIKNTILNNPITEKITIKNFCAIHLSKTPYGVHVEQFFCRDFNDFDIDENKRGSDSVQIDFRHLSKIDVISYNEVILNRSNVHFPLMDPVLCNLRSRAHDVIIQAAIQYSRSKVQTIIKKIEWGERENANAYFFGKIEIIGEDHGVQVKQTVTRSIKGIETNCSGTSSFDFTTLKLEAS